MIPVIKDLMKHNNRGHAVLFSQFRDWRDPSTNSDIFGPVVAYSWTVNGVQIKLEDFHNKLLIQLLPDFSGLICFKDEQTLNNCTLLDAYGKERIRLSIPWEFTKSKKVEAENQESFFINISAPYVNPADGIQGSFGVTARIAHEGKYYFELDYQTGQFLWGKAIWD